MIDFPGMPSGNGIAEYFKDWRPRADFPSPCCNANLKLCHKIMRSAGSDEGLCKSSAARMLRRHKRLHPPSLSGKFGAYPKQ